MKLISLPVCLGWCLAAPLLAAPDDAKAPAEENAPDQEQKPANEKGQILENGSFEHPRVLSRRPRNKGADLTKTGMNAGWFRFRDKQDADGGQLVLGLTNELFHSGKQCLYVEFNKLTKPRVVAELSSNLVAVKGNEPYHVAIWGRMDKQRPITLAQRLPYLKLRVDWLQDDKETQTGDVVLRAQPIPGPLNRKPLFVADRWREFFANIKSPEDAAFAKITWTWESTAEQGETDGVIYFDDASMVGVPGAKEDWFTAVQEATGEIPSSEPPEKPEPGDEDGGAKVPGAEAPKAPAPEQPAPGQPGAK